MLRSRTMTAPTNFRSQVERVAACRAMPMKYSSQPTRFRASTRSALPARGLFGFDADLGESNRLQRPIPRVPWSVGDGIHHVHPGQDLAEDGVLVVQEGGVLLHDEELAGGGIGVGAPGHGDHAAHVAGLLGRAELGLELAGSIPLAP